MSAANDDNNKAGGDSRMSAFTRPQARAPEPGVHLPDLDDLDDDESDAVTVTFFTDHAATIKQERRLSLIALAELIHITAAPTKDQLPWLKLARFGDQRTERGSLRHNANVIAITGLEGDYDGKQMSLAAAKDTAARAEIAVIIYPSPSCTPTEPRWRVLCPFSREYPPAERDRFMARLNGLFEGVFSRESWVWSQSYYYGRVANPDHHATLFEGTPIDLADWLDAGAIGRPTPRPIDGNGQRHPTSRPEDITDGRLRGLLTALLDNITRAPQHEKHPTLLAIARTLGGYQHLLGMSDEQLVALMLGALRDTVIDKNTEQTARDGLAYGRAAPLELEDRPRPGGGDRSGGGGSGDPAPEPDPVYARVLTPDGIDHIVPPDELGEILEAKAEAEPAQEEQPPAPVFGPPTLDDLTMTDLAKMDELIFGKIQKAKAALLGVTPTVLGKARNVAKAAAAKTLRDADKAAKVKANTEPPPPFVTEQDVMRAFVDKYSSILRFNHASGRWLLWAEHYWKPDERKRAFYWSLDLCKAMAPSHSDDGRAVVEKIRFSDAVEKGARTMPAVSTAQSDWDNDPQLLGTSGGIVDLKTGKLRPGNRRDMITMITACAPAATEDCPLWLQFLAETTSGDAATVSFLKRYFGYGLTGLTEEEIILYLFGPGGAGKGTVVKTVTDIMGDYAITAPIELFTEQTFRPSEYYRAKMVGKRLLVAAETERGSYWSESFVKAISGGDEMSGRHPAGQPFNFKPTHKPLIHANHMPKLRGPSTAMERRLRVAPFNYKPANPDTKLKAKLQTEWPGILRWMINGCLDWQRDGLQPPDTISGASKAYFDAQDALGRWIEDCCLLDRNKRLPPTVLRTSYNNWAKANGQDEMDGTAFADAIDQFNGGRLTRGRSGNGPWIKGLDLQPKPTGKPWWMDDSSSGADDGSDAAEP